MNPDQFNGHSTPEVPTDGQPQPPQSPQQPYYNQLPETHYGDQLGAHSNQYDFIMQPGSAARRTMPFPVSSTNKTTKLLIVAAGLVVLVLLFGIVSSLLSKPAPSTADLIKAAQEQTELIRVAHIGDTNAVGATALNNALTTETTLGSANQQLLTYLAKQHVTVSAKTLALTQNKQTDAQLSSALAASTFDTTFEDILQLQLQAYQATLKAAYTANPGPNGRQLLSQQYLGAGLLLEQSQTP